MVPRLIELNPVMIATVFKIALLLLLALAARWGVYFVFRQAEKRMEGALIGLHRLPRIQTLLRLARGIAQVLILILAGLMILQSLDINITPLLASVGVVGLALSLGTQTLVKDYIGGLLILVENQFDVGDVIQVGEVSGTVEQITLRATRLRDLEGRLYTVPNGDIRTISNHTIGWSRAVVEFNLDYDSDIQEAVRILEKASQQARDDPEIKDDLLEPPQASGWVGLKDWAVQVRLMAKTKPGKQWQVASRLRQYALDALHSAGILVATPRPAIEVRYPPSKENPTSGDS